MTIGFIQRFNIRYMVQFLMRAVMRFPRAAALSIVMALLTMNSLHHVVMISVDMRERISLFCLAGFMLSVAIVLFAEGHGKSRREIYMPEIGLLGIAGIAIFLPVQIDVSHAFMLGAIALLLLVSPFVLRKGSEDALWSFVYKSGIAVIFGGISTLILAGGLSAILASIGYLFDIRIADKIYGDIWTLGGFVFFPLYILAGLPRHFDDETPARDIPAPVSFIANYLLVPLMLVYTGILYAYGLKIILQWQLPRGNLAYMVMGFGAVGVLTHLAIHPLRTRGTMLLRFYDRAFYLLLPVPLLLLLAGIWTRIADYGITEPRYTIALILVWLAVLAGMKIFKSRHFHLKYAPLTLAALCLLASFGPWSASNASLKSQLTKLEQHLHSVGVLTADGKVQKATKGAPHETRFAMTSILAYLIDRHAQAALTPWVIPLATTVTEFNLMTGMEFTVDMRAQLRCPPRENCNGVYDLPRHIMEIWGMKPERREAPPLQIAYYHTVPAHEFERSIMDVADYDYIAHVRWLAPMDSIPLPSRAFAQGYDGYTYVLTPEKNVRLDILRQRKVIHSVTLPTQKAAEDVVATGIAQVPTTLADKAVAKAQNGKLRAELRMSYIAVERPKDGQPAKLEDFRGLLLFSIDK